METLWPDFQEDQLLPLSVSYIRKAQEDPRLDPDDYTSATTDYRNVLDKIRGTVQYCANARSSVHSRYIGKFLKYLKTCLDTVENFSGLSSQDKEIKASILQILIAELESTHEQEKRNIDALETVKTSIAKRVHQYLNDAANKERIFNWTEDDIPNKTDYSDVKLYARVAIQKFIWKAIGDYVEECKSESGDLIDQLSEITLRITEKEAKMERFLKNIEKDNVSSQESATDLPTNDYTGDLNKKEIAAIVLTSPLWIPLGIAGMVTVLPVTLAVLKGKQHQKISKYRDNKLEHLNRWTEQNLKNVYTLSYLEYIIFDMLTEKINEKMRNFSKSITNFKNLLKRLDPTKKKKDVIRGYAELRELCCHLDDLLPVLE